MPTQTQAYCERLQDLLLDQTNRENALIGIIFDARRKVDISVERIEALQSDLRRAEQQRAAAAVSGALGTRIGTSLSRGVGAAGQGFLQTEAALRVERLTNEIADAERELTRRRSALDSLLKEQRDVVGNRRTTEADIRRNCRDIL